MLVLAFALAVVLAVKSRRCQSVDKGGGDKFSRRWVSELSGERGLLSVSFSIGAYGKKKLAFSVIGDLDRTFVRN